MAQILSPFIKLLIIALVILVHGYFVATEFALVTLRKTRIQQLAAAGSRPAIRVLATLNNLPELIAAVQLGVTMASLALGALAEPVLAHLLQPAFRFIPEGWKPVTAHGVAIAITFLIITALDIVIAELVPKTIALENSERVAFVVIRPIRVFIVLFRPFLALLNRAGSAVIRLTGLASGSEGHAAHSTEELKMLVRASTRAGVLDADEQEMLFRVFEFSELTARQVMMPRTEVVGLSVDMTRDEVNEIIRTTRHTRYPVYQGSIDNVIGIFYVRDILGGWTAAGSGSGPFDLRRLMRETLDVPDTLHIDELLARMKRRRVHIAVVTDEFGGTAGIVSLEDVLERIVGEVRDEFEREGPEVVELPEGDVLLDGLMLVSDVNERFDLELDERAYDTIGGLVFGNLGRLPEVGDSVVLDGHRLTVGTMDGKRVASVRLSHAPNEPTHDTETATA
jgi:CBS domain containing-hemolysin-like protein